MIPVSTATELAIRAAMSRLLDGKPEQTDGRLTVANLAAEAGVSRATANRASKVLEAFRHAVVESKARRDASDQPAGTARAEQERRAAENVLAQHRQVRALCQLVERRRNGRTADVIPIMGRKGA